MSNENAAVASAEPVKEELKLDYSLESPKERTELVRKIIDSTSQEKLTPKYLEILSDYIIFAMDKEERKQKKILTDNRLVTVNKRETSYQGLVSKLENGEDGLYNMMAGDNKNIIFAPKVSITQKDIDEIPALKQLITSIKSVEEQLKTAVGKRKFLLKKQLIEMYREQYLIKNEFKPPMYCLNVTKSFHKIEFDDEFYFDEDGMPQSDGLISFFNPDHVSALLCNYSKLKQDAWGEFWGDSWYIMEDLDNLIEKTFKEDYPLYYDLIIYKIDGKSNNEIQLLLDKKFNIKHSIEYLSSLWRNKIPKMLAKQTQEDYLNWYYTEKAVGKWKKCTKCGEVKLAHNMFFSKNRGSKDGYYSICKCCRNKKGGNA